MRPTTPIPIEQTVPIGANRGRLASEPAASLARIDEQLGRLADVNDAWRSPAVADENYRRWIAYQNGTGPKVPLALPAKLSIHCRGYAVDSDDWYSESAAQVWRDNGWRQTARYPNNPKMDEPWHGEYFPEHDKFYGQVPAAPEEEEEDEEMKMKGAYYTRKADGVTVYLLFNEVSGFYVEHTGAHPAYNNEIAKQWETNSWVKITEAHAKVLKAALDKTRTRS